MTRKLKTGIIPAVCELCANTEVPEIFSIWGGISAVSACLHRSCQLPQGNYTVFPNTYIVITAASARCRKSTIINIVEDLLKEVRPEIQILGQKATPEALIGDLAGTVMEEAGDNFIKMDASGIVIADELSTFINRKSFDDGMIAILTKLYDCKDLDYRTRKHGKEHIKDPCLCILGGSTIQWIKEAIPVVSIAGGFTARLIFIFQEKREKDVPRPRWTEKEVELKKLIINDLCEIRNMRGTFGLTDKAGKLFDDEYVKFCHESRFFDDPNLAGYAGRRHVLVFKLAMCHSASIKDSREIDEVDMARAINWLYVAEQHMPKVLSAISSEPCGSAGEQLITLIAGRETITRTELVRYFRNKMTIQQLDEIIRTLVEAKYVEPGNVKGNFVYRWIGGKT